MPDKSMSAFPQSGFSSMSDIKNYVSEDCGGVGMTLRDYFAAKALQSLLAMPEFDTVIEACETKEQFGKVKGFVCNNAYSWADAMMKAREE